MGKEIFIVHHIFGYVGYGYEKRKPPDQFRQEALSIGLAIKKALRGTESPIGVYCTALSNYAEVTAKFIAIALGCMTTKVAKMYLGEEPTEEADKYISQLPEPIIILVVSGSFCEFFSRSWVLNLGLPDPGHNLVSHGQWVRLDETGIVEYSYS